MNNNIKKNSLHTVTIEDMTHDGNGVCRIDGFAVFVPNTAVLDVLEIKVVKVLKSYGFGIINRIITKSPHRIDVDCDVFHQCGGCTYRHISYESELLIKQKAVEDAFNRIGGFKLDYDPIVGSEYTNHYRNKAQFPIGYDSNNKLVYGFFAKRSHRIVKCDSCLLQPLEFSAIAKNLCSYMLENKILGYDEKLKKGIIRHLFIRKATQTKEIMVCIVATTKSIPNIEKLAAYLRGKHQNIASIILNVNPDDTNVIMGKECYTIYGKDHITDIMGGVKVSISALSFYQVNKPQAERLYEKALELAFGEEDKNTLSLLDLYCGIGTIGLAGAARAKQVVGIEVVPKAIENAKENAKANGITNQNYICATADTSVNVLDELGTKIDIAVIDPPRKGCDSQTIQTLLSIDPKRIVMVSCNPSTAARDCKLLCESGRYRLTRCIPFDLFPRTTSIECVALLERV